jgi:YhgE/Pip-like protein
MMTARYAGPRAPAGATPYNHRMSGLGDDGGADHLDREEETELRPPAGTSVRASTILRLPGVWIGPLVITAVLIALIALIYIGSVIDPAGHLHGLPVMVVNQDAGATAHGRRVNLGDQIADALQHSPAASKLALTTTSLDAAKAKMDAAKAYGTLVIPVTLTTMTLQAAGLTAPSGDGPPRPALTFLQNDRLGSLGVGLAQGVLTPATAQISAAAAKKLHSNAGAGLIALTPVSYRPLPGHSAVGLSAFYVALLAIMAGFLGATLTNSSVDGALGYATTEIGPRWRQRRPIAINRKQTLLVKLAVAGVASPILTGILLLVSAAALGMHAPHVGDLWLLLMLGAMMIAAGTLALFAAFGAVGQALALILFVYLSLASSGGTVPSEALPGFFRVAGEVEPLRQMLGGTRSILYFSARGDAGLTRAFIVIAAELVFWLAVGLIVTTWYDRKGLYRLAPDLLAYVEQVVDRRPRPLPEAADEAN